MGVKASYYSRITNVEVYRRAGEPRKPTDTLHKLQMKMLQQIYNASINDPLHHVVFSSALKGQNTSHRKNERGQNTTLA